VVNARRLRNHRRRSVFPGRDEQIELPQFFFNSVGIVVEDPFVFSAGRFCIKVYFIFADIAGENEDVLCDVKTLVVVINPVCIH
jgi:hypothetical protein